MHYISIAYSISFWGMYMSLYLWGVLGIKSLCSEYLLIPFWPLFIFTAVMALIHALRFSKKNSVLHDVVPALYGFALLLILQTGIAKYITLRLCLAFSLIFMTLNIEVLKYFKLRKKRSAMIPIRFTQNGFEVTEDLKFLDKRLSWDYFRRNIKE